MGSDQWLLGAPPKDPQQPQPDQQPQEEEFVCAPAEEAKPDHTLDVVVAFSSSAVFTCKYVLRASQPLLRAAELSFCTAPLGMGMLQRPPT